MEPDNSIVKPEQLIGKTWKCPSCHHAETITKRGIKHYGKKHMSYYSLEALFEINMAEVEYEKALHKIMYDE